MTLEKVPYVDRETMIPAQNLNDIQDAIIELEENDTAKGEQISDLEQVTTSTTIGPTAIATFDASIAGMPLKELTVNIEPVQEGSGDPSPENIRPITGWTGAKVMRTGKNLGNFVDGKTIATSGIIVDNEARIATVDPIKIESTKTYKVVCTDTTVKLIYSVWNGNTLVRRDANVALTDSIDTSGGTYFYVCCYKTDPVTVDSIKPMVVFADDADQTFEPYGTTYDITFPTESGTVYGGTLDVTNGVLTVNSFYCETDANGKLVRYMPGAAPTTTSCAWMTSYAYYSLPASVGVFSTNKVQGCNRYNTKYGQGVIDADSNDNACKIRKAANYTRLTFRQTSIPGWGTDGFGASDIEAYFAANPLQVVIPLATPYSIQLTPTEVVTLLGTNNIWADCGDVTVTYGAYLETVKAYSEQFGDNILSAIAPLEINYIASRVYTVGSYLFVGTKFYKVTAAIGVGDTISTTTNVTQTTVADQLMALAGN